MGFCMLSWECASIHDAVSSCYSSRLMILTGEYCLEKKREGKKSRRCVVVGPGNNNCVWLKCSLVQLKRSSVRLKCNSIRTKQQVFPRGPARGNWGGFGITSVETLGDMNLSGLRGYKKWSRFRNPGNLGPHTPGRYGHPPRRA